jgi:Tfp pilus assembly protein PilO
VVVAGGWFLLISPQRSSVASLNAQAVAVDSTNAGISAKIAQLKAQAAELPGEQAALAAIARRLPPDLREANLLNDLSHAADAANVDLQGVTPSAPVAVGAAAVAAPAPVTTAAGTSATTSTSTTLPKVAVAANQLYQVPLLLTVSGNYFDLEMFIHSLEGMQRAMLINQLTFVRPTLVVVPGTAAVGGAGATTAGTGGSKSTKSTGTSGKASTGSSKHSKSTGKPLPGTSAAAQAELDAHPAVPVDTDTLTVTISGAVFSLYSAAAAAAAAPAVSVTPAPTK